MLHIDVNLEFPDRTNRQQSKQKAPLRIEAGQFVVIFITLLSVADNGEILSLEGSAAYEAAVDVRLSEETGFVLSVAGTTVLDGDSFSALLAVELSDDATNELADFLSLLVCSCLACADSPDRLISDCDLAELVSRDILESANDLTLDPVECLACFTLCKRLTAADDRSYAVLEESESLLVDCLVGLSIVLTSLGVADDAVVNAHLSEPER